MRRHLSIGLTFLCAVAAQAASIPQQPGDRIAPDFRPPTKGARLLVMPVQVADANFGKGQQPIEQELFARLEKLGYRPVALKGSKFEGYWPEVMRQVEATADPRDRNNKAVGYARAVGTMAKIVANDPDYAMLLSPVIVDRVVQIDSDMTSWDGVRRSPPLAIKDGIKTWVRTSHGTGLALSLQVTGFGEGGRFAFATYGGLTLPGQPNLDTHTITTRPDPFEDKDEIEEGVRVALRPLEAR